MRGNVSVNYIREKTQAMKAVVIIIFLCGVLESGGTKEHNRFKRSWYYTCPQQTDLSVSFRLSADGTNYPEAAIDNELKNRVDGIAACLARQTVPPNATKVPDDPILDTFTRETCPIAKQMLRRYFNTAFNSTCWIILNVQEMINIVSCKNPTCQFCRTGRYDLQNRCFLQFDVFSVWSFCEELPLLSQIFRDRIIVPNGCVCRQVQCRRAFDYYYNHFW